MAKYEFFIELIKPPLNDDGRSIMEKFLHQKRNIAIGASAGTGKTTLLTIILTEAVIRDVKAGRPAPFDRIMAVTFTVEAARQMKEKVRKMLSDYHAKDNLPDFEMLLASLESDSWISTLDSLTARLVQKMGIDMGVPPEISVIDSYDLDQLERKALKHARDKKPAHYEVLEIAFGEDLHALLHEAMETASMYTVDTQTFLQRIQESSVLFYESAVKDLQFSTSESKALKRYNTEVAAAFKEVFPLFVEIVNQDFRMNGQYTYDSIREAVVNFLSSIESKEWREYFGSQFEYVFVDEFQDTSYAQARLLSEIVGPDSRIMVIGDPKQSIYTWRNAEPQIFMDLIANAQKNRRDITFGRAFYYDDIKTNFRSNEALVDLANFLFGKSNTESIFNDSKYTGDYDLPHPDVKCDKPKTIPSISPPHVHHYHTGSDVRGGKERLRVEADFITSILAGIQAGKSKLEVRQKDQGRQTRWEEPKLGDCAILIPRRTNWGILRRKMIDNNIPYVMIADQGFYKRPEVSLLIDFLDWLGNPYQRDALLRILRSPLVGVTDYFLRVLSTEKYRLDSTRDRMEQLVQKTSNRKEKDLIDKDLISVTRVLNLKNNLRWSREGRKAELLERILSSSHFREILMCYHEGAQCVANLNMLCEIVQSWEEEELIPYSELVSRLRFYRAGDRNIQTQAVLSDLENRDAVKVATIHATKGLEFPIVFLYDVDASFKRQWRTTNCGYFGSPRYLFVDHAGEFIHLRQIPEPGTHNDVAKKIDSVYCSEPPNTGLEFVRRLQSMYKAFVAEKWRLYYVALTRAADHIFHGYGSKDSDASHWGNEFRNRLQEYLRANTSRNGWVRQLKTAKIAAAKAVPPKPWQYKARSTISKMAGEYYPSSLDPTHIYDLYVCPRRYQYTALQHASGMKCEEAGYSSFSPHFGQVLHHMVEVYDYEAHNDSASLEYMNRQKYLKDQEKELLQSAIAGYAEFFKKFLKDNDLASVKVTSEKAVQSLLTLKDRRIILRGVIDLVLTDDSDLYILDMKTNYAKIDSSDTEEERAFKKFINEHHEFQLLTYKSMLTSLEFNVKGMFIISVSKSSPQSVKWDAIQVSDDQNVVALLKDILPLSIVEDGLRKVSTAPTDPCPHCEFKALCN